MSPLAFVLDLFLSIFFFIVFARVLINFAEFAFRDWTPRGFVAVFCEIIFSITDPPLRLIGKFIPPIRVGGVALDLAPLILMLSIAVLRILIVAIL